MEKHLNKSTRTEPGEAGPRMGRSRRSDIATEVKKQLWLAGPLFIFALLQYSVQVISLMFVGHLGDQLALSGASVATSFASVTGFNLLMGLASALDTLCGQSFGADHHHMLGLHTQRAMIILLTVSIFLAILWANTKSILVSIQQDPNISEEAGLYTYFMIPSLFAFALLYCIFIFLQTQSIILPMILTSGTTTVLHALLCWTLVLKSGLGSRGAALANSISYWINVLLLGLYIKFSSSCKRTWSGFSRKAFHDIVPFLKVAIPAALMLCLTAWSIDLMVLLSGLLPNPKLETSVISICLNTFVMIWMISFGLGAAVSIRVSNELGANDPKAAHLAASVSVAMSIIVGVVVGLILISVRNIWPHVYSDDNKVVTYVAVIMPILAASCLLDGIQSVLSGIVRGIGRQKIGAFINLGSFYFVGLPSSIIFAFVLHLKGKGLWFGIICAFTVQVISLLILMLRTSWEEEVRISIFYTSKFHI